MKLSYYCSSCKKENYINTKAPDRYVFLQEYGDYDFKERCSNCGFITKKSINRLHAEPNKLILIGGILLAIIILFFTFKYGAFSFTIMSIPTAIWIQQNKKTAIFNKSRVR